MISFFRKFELSCLRIAAKRHANKLLERLRNLGPYSLSFGAERWKGSW
jgi:hypothetical protein